MPREIAVFTLLLACTNGSLMTVRLIFMQKRKDFLLPSCSKRKVSRLIIFGKETTMFDVTLLILLGLAALGFISHNTTVAVSILVLIIVRVTPLSTFSVD